MGKRARPILATPHTYVRCLLLPLPVKGNTNHLGSWVGSERALPLWAIQLTTAAACSQTL